MDMDVDDALHELDRIGQWRGFILLPPDATDLDALVKALPWVKYNVCRPGTVVRLFELQDGVALIMGGALTDDEGAHLFRIHDQLKGIARRVFIVPPETASQDLIARMHEASVAPIPPVPETLLLKRNWGCMVWLILVVCLINALLIPLAGYADSMASAMKPAILLLILAPIAHLMIRRRRQQQLTEIRLDPVRSTQGRWATILASRAQPGRRLG